jgi:hypothetical protein
MATCEPRRWASASCRVAVGRGYVWGMAAPPARVRGAVLPAGLWPMARGLAHPAVLTLVLGAVFSYLAGDTVRAGCLLALGVALAWDRARRGVARPPAAAGEGTPGTSGRAGVLPDEPAGRRRAAVRGLRVPAVGAAVAYSLVVGWFPRYSWPATIAVTIPCAAAVLIAWRVAADSAGEPGRLPRAGMAAWALVGAGAAAWELTALALQPTLGTDSPAHPTLSYLANPVLASAAGRPAVLFGWLALGWYLARR